MTASSAGQARLTRLARGLLLLLVAAVVIVLLVDALDPAGADRGEHSVVMVAVVVATIALAQLAAVLLRRHRSIWRPVRPLWTRSDAAVHQPPLPAVVELDALIISASTGGSRARDRLDRRLTGLGLSPLAQHLATTEPSPEQVVSAVARVIEHAVIEHPIVEHSTSEHREANSVASDPPTRPETEGTHSNHVS